MYTPLKNCSGCAEGKNKSVSTHSMHTIQHPCPEGGDPTCGYCFPYKTNLDTAKTNCECKRLTCPSDCKRKHTHKTFFCHLCANKRSDEICRDTERIAKAGKDLYEYEEGLKQLSVEEIADSVCFSLIRRSFKTVDDITNAHRDIKIIISKALTRYEQAVREEIQAEQEHENRKLLDGFAHPKDCPGCNNQ